MLLIPENGILFNRYYKETAEIYERGSGKKRAFELMMSLALCGPSTTSEVVEFVLKSTYYQNLPKGEIKKNTLRDDYNRIIQNRFEKKSGKRKIGKKFPGLLEKRYVIQTGHKIVGKKKTGLYFLTLKGCFFVLGFDLNDEQLACFIKNSARNHLFFYFLKELLQHTSVKFVREYFVEPIQDLIERKRIDLSDEMYLNFGLIADVLGITLYEKRKAFFVWSKGLWDHPTFNEIEELRKLVIYVRNPRKDWYRSIVEFYYKDDDELDFYLDYSEDQFEMSLFNKVMYQFLHGYHEAVPEDTPIKSGLKIPYPKRSR